MKTRKKNTLFICLALSIITFFNSCAIDYEKTISTTDLTEGKWYLENSQLRNKLNTYMEERGLYAYVFRTLEFTGTGKNGTVLFKESLDGGESCRMEGTYTADASSGSLKIKISGLQNSNGYCSFYNDLNGIYEYKYVLMSDIDPKYEKLYSGKKTLSLWKNGSQEIVFQKSVND